MCPDPGVPAHGKRLNNDFRDGKLVAFECNHNYDLLGSKTITCNGGVWSGNTPQCKGNSRIINGTSQEPYSIPCCYVFYTNMDIPDYLLTDQLAWASLFVCYLITHYTGLVYLWEINRLFQ